jgi:hypothetical protein
MGWWRWYGGATQDEMRWRGSSWQSERSPTKWRRAAANAELGGTYRSRAREKDKVRDERNGGLLMEMRKARLDSLMRAACQRIQEWRKSPEAAWHGRMSETMYRDAVMEKEKMGRDPTMLKGSSSQWELGVTKTGSPNEIRPSTNKCTFANQ